MTSPRFEEVVREARQELGRREVEKVDWDAVDRKLFAQIEVEARVEPARLQAERGGGWAVGAAVLAAAAALALVVGKTRETGGSEVLLAEGAPVLASNVALVPPGAVLLIDGKPASTGAVVHLGDVLEARGSAAVTFARPGKLTWLLEPGSVADVTRVEGALVLGLERGAVEAQVIPVPSGEAFAVDVDGARVAVHGTHLRVERVGDRVAVDLNEGVVVVGPAPRVGSTIGTLVTAPAHADFGATDCAGGHAVVAVSHDPSDVRAPVALGGAGGTAAVASAAIAPPVSNPRVADARPVPALQRTHVAAPPPTAVPQPEPVQVPPQPDPAADSTIAAAVRSCLSARTNPENVAVGASSTATTVHTTLHVELDADGNVKAAGARFDPPVAPDVNMCAAATIYRTRFTHDGSADIAVDFRMPSSAP